MVNILKTYPLLKQTQGGIKTWKTNEHSVCYSNKELSLKKTSLDPQASGFSSSKLKEKMISIPSNLLQKIEKRGKLPSLFNRTNIPLIPKPKKIILENKTMYTSHLKTYRYQK